MIFTPEDRSAGVPEQEMRQAAAAGRAEDERWHMRKDGSRFWGGGVMASLRGEGGSVRGFVKVFRDESARQQLKEAQTVALNAAEHANHSKDEFLATLSHELRTPLSAILLWTNVLNSHSDRNTLEEGLAAIRNGAESQRHLIEDLLDTSRITSGHLRLRMRRTDFASIVQSALESVLPSAQTKGVRMVADMSPSVGVVEVDPDRMRQVLWNLLTNAVKFTPAEGTIEVKTRRMGELVELIVHDNGQGIPKDFLPHVFELFRQGEPATTRRQGGLGLGLAICKRLVEQHGGKITAASDGPGRGSTFTVTLPLPVRSDSEPDAAQRAAAKTPVASIGNARVLLVEDDEETRGGLAVVLRSAGANVVSANSVASALSAFRASRPDVIVSDVGMPGEDGYSFIRKIRQIEKESKSEKVPALALTAFATADDQKKAIAAGFNQHLGKPVEPEDLVAVVKKLLAK
jgi:signal transduction histidine kinase/ActR/RegA family two-component response regulator